MHNDVPRFLALLLQERLSPDTDPQCFALEFEQNTKSM